MCVCATPKLFVPSHLAQPLLVQFAKSVKRIAYLLLVLLPALAVNAAEVWTNRVEVADRHALASMTCGWSITRW